MRKCVLLGGALLSFVLLILAVPQSAAQDMRLERDRMKAMLKVVAHNIEDNFYDPNLHGLDWKTLTDQARERIDKANSLGEMVAAIFSLVEKLEDSHTKFLPPERATKYIYGFKAKPYDDAVYIYEVKEGSPAGEAGLKIGDRLWSVNGYRAERKTFDLMMLFYRILRPAPALQLEFSRGDAPPQKLLLKAEVKKEKLITDLTNDLDLFRLLDELEGFKEEYRYLSYADEVGYLYLPSFTSSERFLSGLADKVKDSKAFIIDLRDNHGGAVDVLNYFVGLFEDEPQVIFEMVGRKKTEPQEAKPHKPALRGPLFILVDSESASAAEIFARHFQRTRRAVVIGDRSSGRVSASRFYPEQLGTSVILPFGVQVAVARVVFPGGEELEKQGVTPDQACVPTGHDLLEKSDPCLYLARKLARKSLGLPEEPPEEKKTEKRAVKY